MRRFAAVAIALVALIAAVLVATGGERLDDPPWQDAPWI